MTSGNGNGNGNGNGDTIIIGGTRKPRSDIGKPREKYSNTVDARIKRASIASNISQAMKYLGIGAPELQIKSGLSINTILAAANGSRNLSRASLQAIARGLNVSETWLTKYSAEITDEGGPIRLGQLPISISSQNRSSQNSTEDEDEDEDEENENSTEAHTHTHTLGLELIPDPIEPSTSTSISPVTRAFMDLKRGFVLAELQMLKQQQQQQAAQHRHRHRRQAPGHPPDSPERLTQKRLLALRLRLLLRARNLKQFDLEQASGLSQQTIYNILKGLSWPSYHSWPRIQKAFPDLTIAQLQGVHTGIINEYGFDEGLLLPHHYFGVHPSECTPLQNPLPMHAQAQQAQQQVSPNPNPYFDEDLFPE